MAILTFGGGQMIVFWNILSYNVNYIYIHDLL